MLNGSGALAFNDPQHCGLTQQVTATTRVPAMPSRSALQVLRAPRVCRQRPFTSGVDTFPCRLRQVNRPMPSASARKQRSCVEQRWAGPRPGGPRAPQTVKHTMSAAGRLLFQGLTSMRLEDCKPVRGPSTRHSVPRPTEKGQRSPEARGREFGTLLRPRRQRTIRSAGSLCGVQSRSGFLSPLPGAPPPCRCTFPTHRPRCFLRAPPGPCCWRWCRGLR